MALIYEMIKRAYILGQLDLSALDQGDYAVVKLVKEILLGEVEKINFQETDLAKLGQQLQKLYKRGDIDISDLQDLAVSDLAGIKAASKGILDEIGRDESITAGVTNVPPVASAVVQKQLPIEVIKQLDQLRTGFVIDLDKATIQTLIKSYARGEAVATWEATKEKARIPLGGPDPQRQITKLMEMMQPIHEYNENLATVMTKRISDQLAAGIEPGVIKEGMNETIVSMMRTPIEVPLKGPDGTPKLDKDGKQIVRVYSPESYANMLSRTVTYSLRNEGYLDHYRTMNNCDGWISICSDDERSCEPCVEKDGQFFSWESGQEPPSYHPFCRCRPKAHFIEEE